MTYPPIIGLSGKARSGKDTVAEMLVTKHGYTRVGMADQMKVVVGLLFGWNKRHLYGDLKETVDEFWGMSPRQVMQRFGTDAMRANFGENFWCRAMERQITERANWEGKIRPTVIPDIRFPNEADMVHKLGGQVWRLERLDGRPAINEHVSETALDHFERFDAEIHAPTGVSNLQTLAEILLGGLKSGIHTNRVGWMNVPVGHASLDGMGVDGGILVRGPGLTTR